MAVLGGVLLYTGVINLSLSQPTKRLLIGAGLAVLFVTWIMSTGDGCYIDWDGRSNSTICD